MTGDDLHNDDHLLAAEYVLGLLSDDEATAARQRAATDHAFAQSVTAWEIRFADLAEEIAPEVPSAASKRALLSRMFPEPAPLGFWQRTWVWQAASALCLLVLAIFFLADFGRQTGPDRPLYTAEIVAEAGDFRVIAVVDKSTNEVILTRTAGSAPEGRILQVWAHGEGEPAISVGLWPEGDSVRLPMPPTIAAVRGVLTLGVSEEPPGGSPTGSPSGRVFGTVDIPGI